MNTATLSNRFQLTIPKAVREDLGLQAGQKLSIVVKGRIIELVPMRSMEQVLGIFKGANPDGYRDRKDRV